MNNSYKMLRGKFIEILGGNVVNSVNQLKPELFPYSDIENISVEFPEDVQIALTSNDLVDTDYRLVKAGNSFELSGISIKDIKIKSINSQTGYIYTAGI